MDNSAQTNPAQSTSTPAPTETPAPSSPPNPPSPTNPISPASPTVAEPTIEQTPPPAAPPIAEQTVETPASSSTLTPPTFPTPQTPTPADQTNPAAPTTMPDPFAQASAAVQVPAPGNPTDPTILTESTIPQTDPQAPPPANPITPTPPSPTPQTPPASPTASKGGSAFKTILIIFLILGILAAVARFILPAFGINIPFLAAKKENLAKVCAQVISPAKNIKTGECKEFPTPCDIPAGWTKVSSCTPIPTPTIDATADWKTYTNTKNNYSVKYPNDLDVKDMTLEVKGPTQKAASNIDSLVYINPANQKFTLADYKFSVQVSTKTYEQELELITGYEGGISPEGRTETDITISGYPGKRFTGKIMGMNGDSSFEEIKIIINKNKKPYIFSAKKTDENMLNQILSTFKFTNSTPSATPTEKNSSDSAKTATPTPKLVK